MSKKARHQKPAKKPQKLPFQFPTVTCIICQSEVLAIEAAQVEHLASRAHALNSMSAAIQKVTGWSCPGPLFPMQRPIAHLE